MANDVTLNTGEELLINIKDKDGLIDTKVLISLHDNYRRIVVTSELSFESALMDDDNGECEIDLG